LGKPFSPDGKIYNPYNHPGPANDKGLEWQIQPDKQTNAKTDKGGKKIDHE
jgi:hypothetical protein